MSSGTVAYLVVFAVAAGVTAALVPVVSWVCRRTGTLYHPSERTVHREPLPMLGGLAMVGGAGAGLAAAATLGRFAPVFSTTQILGVAGAGLLAFGTGFIDDLRPLSPPAKVAGMVLAGSVLSLAGVSLIYFRIPFWDLLVLSPDLAALMTVVWLVGMGNAINLVDGLDGLAAGITAIASAAFLLYGVILVRDGVIDASNPGPLTSALVLGACVGFLPYNFHPASIMMGDGGALFLGAMMAAATVSVGGSTDDPHSGQAWFFFAPLLVPLLILGVPILDTAWSILRRAFGRQGVTAADRRHVHHRLLALGHGHRRAVLILWAWTALLSGLVLIPVITGRGDGMVPLGLAALALALFTFFAPWFSANRERDDDEFDG